MKKNSLRSLRVVDLVGLGVFVAVIATAVFFFLRRAQYVTLTLRVSQSDSLDLYGAPSWYLENLKPGMQEKDVFGRPLISLVRTYNYPSNAGYEVMYVTMKLLSTYNKRSNTYNYEGVPLLIGSFQSFKFNGILVRGVVHRIDNENQKREEKKFLVKGFINPVLIGNQDALAANAISNGVDLYLSRLFEKGLEMKDFDGKVVAKINDIKKSFATRKFIYQNSLIEVPDYQKEKIELEVELTTVKVGENYLFREETPMIINSNIYLDFLKFGGTMTVTDIKEI